VPVVPVKWQGGVRNFLSIIDLHWWTLFNTMAVSAAA
jgi:hypothetical protein